MSMTESWTSRARNRNRDTEPARPTATLGEWLDAMSGDDDQAGSRRARAADPKAGVRETRDGGDPRGADAILRSALEQLDARERRFERRADDMMESLDRWMEQGERSAAGRKGGERDARLDSALDQIERRLGDIAGRIEDRLSQRAGAPAPASDLDARLADIARRIDDAHAARRPDPQDAERLARLESTLGALAKRLEARPEEAPAALNGPRRRLRPAVGSAAAEIRAHQLALDGEAPARPAAEDLGDRIAAIAERLETAQTRAIAPAVDSVRAEIAALAARLDRAPAAPSASPPDLSALTAQVEQIKSTVAAAMAQKPAPATDIAALNAKLEEIRETVAHKSTPAPDLSSLASAIGAQMEQLRYAVIGAVASKPTAAPAVRPDDLKPLHDQIASLSARLDAPRAVDFKPLHDQIASLTQRIDDQQRAVDLSPLREQMDALGASVAAALRDQGEANPIQLLDGLELRIDAAGGRISNDVRSQIQVAIIELRQAIAAGATHQPPESLARAVQELGARFDAAQARRDDASGPDNAQIERVAEEMRAMARQLDPSSAVAKIESQLLALDAKLDDVKSARPVLVSGKGAAKVVAPDLSGVEAMIQNLADRMEATRAEQSNNTQFEELQAQVREVAAKLDRVDGAQSLSSIERTVADLFAQIDGLRTESSRAAEAVARQAAEAAARDVADDLVRRAAADLSDAAAHHPRIHALAQDISDMRRTTDLVDRKTHETLEAIHTALEKIVERLGAVERDVGGVRALAEPAPVAAAAPPIPAPSPRQSAPRAAAPAIEDAPLTTRVTGRRQAAVVEPEQAKSRFAIKLPFLNREKPAAAPSAPAGARATPAPARAAEPDLPLEPGSGRPSATVGKAGAEAATALKAQLVAAARRASQLATDEVAKARAEAKPAPDAAVSSAAGATEGVKTFIETRKKPILIGLAALLLAVIALNVLAPNGDPASKPRVEDKISQPLPAPAPSASAPEIASAPAPEPRAEASAPAPQIDAEPTGSIPARPEAPAMTMPPLTPPATTAIEIPAAIASPTLRSAALRGDPGAAHEIGVRLIDGRGVARDPKLALKWFERAAAEGLAPAQFRVGNMYEKGIGATRDPKLAKTWYERAAQKGNAKALHNLGVLIAEGGDGKPDYAAAADHFMKAAKLGVRDSQYNVAILLARGLGVTPSMTEAYTWLAIAAAQGDDEAAKKRDEIGGRLTPEELTSARAAAAAFKPQTQDRFANDVAAPDRGWDAAAPAPAPAAKGKGKSEGARI